MTAHSQSEADGARPPEADEATSIDAAGAAPAETDPRESSMARKIAVGTAGGVVTAAGLVMLVTPGPGILVTLSGLGILSSEFPAARRALDRIRRRR